MLFRSWDTDADPYDVDAPKAFRQSTRLAQHTSFLKDVFRTYKDFTTAQIDTIEIMLTKLYTEWGITEDMDFSQMRPEDYPILSELYDFIEIEYENLMKRSRSSTPEKRSSRSCWGCTPCAAARTRNFSTVTQT